MKSRAPCAKECPDERDADEKDRAEEHDEGRIASHSFQMGRGISDLLRLEQRHHRDGLAGQLALRFAIHDDDGAVLWSGEADERPPAAWPSGTARSGSSEKLRRFLWHPGIPRSAVPCP